MKVWIINPYGNIPSEGWSPYRSTSIAQALIKRGHEVVWWVSDFEHRSKKKRTCGTMDYGNGFSIKVLPSAVYDRHISFARIRYEREYARSLHQAVLRSGDRPDVIVHGEPAVCFSDISIKTVRHCNCPLVIDVIDLWPELFEIVVPRPIRWIARFSLTPLYLKRKWFLQKADGLIAVSRDYLKTAQDLAPGTPGQVVYLGTDLAAFRMDREPTVQLPRKGSGEVWCIYVGTLGRNYDIPAILESCRALSRERVRIVVAGDGDMRPQVEAAAARGELTYLGRLSFSELTSIYGHFDIALACYAAGSTVSMPFKAFDYLAAGLPVITSLGGDLAEYVTGKAIGMRYQAGDVSSLCAAVRALACDPQRRENARSAARQLGEEMDYSKQYSIAADFIEKISKTASSH